MGICIIQKYLYNEVRHSLRRTNSSRIGIFVDFAAVLLESNVAVLFNRSSLSWYIIRVLAEDPIMIGFASKGYTDYQNRIGLETACLDPNNKFWF